MFLGLDSENSQNSTSAQATKEISNEQTSLFQNCPNLTSVSLPSTITSISTTAFTQCPSLRSIYISPQNQIYASYEGMLFTKDLTKLLLVPEGMEDTAILPDATDTVPVGAFSHSAQLNSVSVRESCDFFSSENGILYSKDKTTLVAAPVGYGDAVVIPKSATALAPSAFAGITLKSIVCLGGVATIDPTAFSDAAKAEATVVLPAGPDYESSKAVWMQAGFTKFQEPLKPGDSTAPEDSTPKGLSYTLQDNYTLSVSWQGDTEPEASLIIPTSANLSGTTYRVSSISAAAFQDQTTLTSVVIPSSISSIGDYAFAGCTNLNEVSLLEGITTLGESSFEGTALTHITLPRSVAIIKDRVFANSSELTRVVALSTIDSVAPSALEGCMKVSILTPYLSDGLYTWSPGISALGNHLEPYGIPVTDEPLTLTQDEHAELFASSEVFIPEDIHLTYAYQAACVSVDTQGRVTGITPGISDVIYALVVDDIALVRESRSVEVVTHQGASSTPNIFEQEEAFDLASDHLPLTGSLLVMSGTEIESRVAAGDKEFGGCTWDIANGVLTIKPTPGGTGVLGEFGDSAGAPWYSVASSIKSVTFERDVIAGSSLGYMFADCSSLTAIDFSNFDTASVTNMSYMFINCSNLTAIDLSNFKTAKVIRMIKMFTGCSGLKTLNLSNFDTSSVVDMGSLFLNCSSLVELNLSSFKTENVITMADAFRGCTSLTDLDLSNFNTANVTNMRSMFDSCSSLTTLDLSNFNTANVTIMNYMFIKCSGLTSLDLSSFSTSLDLDTTDMFLDTQQLATITLGSFYTKELPQKGKSDLNAATQAVYTGWWIAQSDGSLHEGGKVPKKGAGTYTTQLTYAVTFSGNNATSGVAPSNINAICGTSFQIPAQGDLQKTGYTFVGWNTKSDGSGSTYDASSMQADLSGIVNGVVELYAKWTSNTYTIRFNGNKPAGANVTGANDDIVAKYDTAAKLPASGFICDSYAFTGWTTDHKGQGTHYAANQEVTNLTSEQDGVVTLYAEWKGSTYTVSFDANPPAGVSFEGSTPDKVFQFGVWDSLPKNGYRCQGFSFKGWTITQDGTGELYVDGQSAQNIASQGSTSVKLYAQWAETYNVTIPVAPTVSIDAQGQVASDTITDTFFRSNNDVRVSVARIESAALPGAQEIFPNCPTDGSRWNAVQVTAADKAEPDPPIYVPINGAASTGFEIPGNAKFPVIFGLKIAPGTEIIYKETATEVFRLTYVFAVAS